MRPHFAARLLERKLWIIPARSMKLAAAKGLAAETFGRVAEVAGVGITRIGQGYGLKINLSEAPVPRLHCQPKSPAFPCESKS